MDSNNNQGGAHKPRVLSDLKPPVAPQGGAAVVAPKPGTPEMKDKGPIESRNGQKARTLDDERAAWRRRIMRWHRKATIALGEPVVKGLLTEASAFTVADTADAK
jgi:hypothetical protein